MHKRKEIFKTGRFISLFSYRKIRIVPGNQVDTSENQCLFIFYFLPHDQTCYVGCHLRAASATSVSLELERDRILGASSCFGFSTEGPGLCKVVWKVGTSL